MGILFGVLFGILFEGGVGAKSGCGLLSSSSCLPPSSPSLPPLSSCPKNTLRILSLAEVEGTVQGCHQERCNNSKMLKKYQNEIQKIVQISLSCPPGPIYTNLNLYMCVYALCVYMIICICRYTCIYLYIYIFRYTRPHLSLERDSKRECRKEIA